MSDNYDYEALDEDIFPRSNGSNLSRPKDRSLSRSRTRSPPTRRTGDGSRFSNSRSRSRSRSPNRRYPNHQPSPVAHGHSQNDDQVLDEDLPTRSNGSYSPRAYPSRYGSRSRSPPARRTRNFRSRSRSPGLRYSHRKHSPVPHHRPHYNQSTGNGGHTSTNHPNPEPSRCLGVFGLSAYTEENDIRELFSRYGRIHEVRIIYDGQTKRSRGFGFIDFDKEDDATEAKNRCNGIELAGRQIRVDFAVKQRPHKPTPGIYMGKIRSGRGSDRGGYVRDSRDCGGYDRRRSPPRPSNYGRYPNSRSRSPPRQRHYR